MGCGSSTETGTVQSTNNNEHRNDNQLQSLQQQQQIQPGADPEADQQDPKQNENNSKGDNQHVTEFVEQPSEQKDNNQQQEKPESTDQNTDLQLAEQSDEDSVDQQNQEFTEFQLEVLKAHNDFRDLHGAPHLTLNREICNMAQRYAEKLATEKKFEHSNSEDRKYKDWNCGENLARAGDINGFNVTKMWYDEIDIYNYNKPEFAMGTGHFTQVIWNGTVELGIGRGNDDDGSHIYCANYYPPGNVQGGFPGNVNKLLNNSII